MYIYMYIYILIIHTYISRSLSGSETIESNQRHGAASKTIGIVGAVGTDFFKICFRVSFRISLGFFLGFFSGFLLGFLLGFL